MDGNLEREKKHQHGFWTLNPVCSPSQHISSLNWKLIVIKQQPIMGDKDLVGLKPKQIRKPQHSTSLPVGW